MGRNEVGTKTGGADQVIIVAVRAVSRLVVVEYLELGSLTAVIAGLPRRAVEILEGCQRSSYNV